MKLTMMRTWLTAAFLALVAAGCSSADTSPTATARATLTPIPVYQYVAPTEPPQMATVAALTATSPAGVGALDPERVERGRDRYVVLECGACHGDSGEGTADGAALTDYAANEADFISFMRSGGSLGAAHQYATNRLSDTGGRNLYQYLLSLRGQS